MTSEGQSFKDYGYGMYNQNSQSSFQKSFKYPQVNNQNNNQQFNNSNFSSKQMEGMAV